MPALLIPDLFLGLVKLLVIIIKNQGELLCSDHVETIENFQGKNAKVLKKVGSKQST